MAEPLILTNCFISVDGVEFSSLASNVEITSEKEVHDVTGFGAQSRKKALGLGDGTINMNLFQAFDAGSIDDTLWAAHIAGTPVEIIVKPFNEAGSATNPVYVMQGLLPSYTPLSGDVGAPSTITANFQNADDAGIQRLEADPASGSGSGS